MADVDDRFVSRTALVTGGSRGIGRAVADAGAGGRARCGQLPPGRSRGNEVVPGSGPPGERHGARRRRLGARGGPTARARRRRRLEAAGHPRQQRRHLGGGPRGRRPGRLGPHLAINQRGAFSSPTRRFRSSRRQGIDRVRVVDRGPARRGAALRLRSSKGAIISYTKSLASGARAAGHPRQLRRARLGGNRHDAASLADPAGARDRGDPDRPGGLPEDIAGPVLFLVSDLARHLQGEILNVNGGSVLAG